MYQKNKKIDCILSANLKSVDDLQKLMNNFQQYSDAHTMNEKLFFDFKLCLEEVVVNVFSHGYKKEKIDPEVSVSLYKSSAYFIADVIDNASTFNPLSIGVPLILESSLESRPIGGLGIHLMKNLSDEIEYIPQLKGNRLKIYKNI